MLYVDNLNKIIFHRHELFNCDELVILSGYVGPSPVQELNKLPVDAKVIYGMYGCDGIGSKLHFALCDLNTRLQNVEIKYSTIPVHSKCYMTASSIFSKSSSGCATSAPSARRLRLPASRHCNLPIFSILHIRSALNGIKGSQSTARLAHICKAVFSTVAVYSGLVFICFHGSVSVRYLLPTRARFISSANASRKR